MISKVGGKRFVYKFVCDLKQLIGLNAQQLADLVNSVPRQPRPRRYLHTLSTMDWKILNIFLQNLLLIFMFHWFVFSSLVDSKLNCICTHFYQWYLSQFLLEYCEQFGLLLFFGYLWYIFHQNSHTDFGIIAKPAKLVWKNRRKVSSFRYIRKHSVNLKLFIDILSTR